MAKPPPLHQKYFAFQVPFFDAHGLHEKYAMHTKANPQDFPVYVPFFSKIITFLIWNK